MSMYLTGVVLNSGLRGNSMLLMLLLADSTGDEYNFFDLPPVDRLAWETGLTPKTVARLLSRFKAHGWILPARDKMLNGLKGDWHRLNDELLPVKESWEKFQANQSRNLTVQEVAQ